MSLGAAREARAAAARLLKSGVDPALQAKQLAAMRLEEAETSFEAVAREWHGQQMGGWVPRHAADVIKSLEQDVFPKPGSLPIKGITSPMVLEVIRAIEDRPSIETARRVRQRISAVYAYAIASGRADTDAAGGAQAPDQGAAACARHAGGSARAAPPGGSGTRARHDQAGVPHAGAHGSAG